MKEFRISSPLNLHYASRDDISEYIRQGLLFHKEMGFDAADLDMELFDKYSFFEMYPFDGGGSFINREIIGTVDDAGYTASVTEKDALAMFGGYKEVDFLRFESWRTIERTSWINRMYFIVPLANHARKTDTLSIFKLLNGMDRTGKGFDQV